MTTNPREIEAASRECHELCIAFNKALGAPGPVPAAHDFAAILRRHFTTTAPAEQSSLEAALSSRQWPMMSRGMEIGSITLAPCAVHEIIRLCKKHFAADPQPAHLHADKGEV